MRAEGRRTGVVDMSRADAAPDDDSASAELDDSAAGKGGGGPWATTELDASSQSVPAARAWARGGSGRCVGAGRQGAAVSGRSRLVPAAAGPRAGDELRAARADGVCPPPRAGP